MLCEAGLGHRIPYAVAELIVDSVQMLGFRMKAEVERIEYDYDSKVVPKLWFHLGLARFRGDEGGQPLSCGLGILNTAPESIPQSSPRILSLDLAHLSTWQLQALRRARERCPFFFLGFLPNAPAVYGKPFLGHKTHPESWH